MLLGLGFVFVLVRVERNFGSAGDVSMVHDTLCELEVKELQDIDIAYSDMIWLIGYIVCIVLIQTVEQFSLPNRPMTSLVNLDSS